MSKKSISIVDQILLQSEAILAADQEKDLRKLKQIGSSLSELLDKAYWEHPEILWLPRVRAARAVVRRLKRGLYIQRRRPIEISGGAFGLGRRH